MGRRRLYPCVGVCGDFFGVAKIHQRRPVAAFDATKYDQITVGQIVRMRDLVNDGAPSEYMPLPDQQKKIEKKQS